MPARGLYLITPDELDTARLLARVVPVLDAGVACLQYRNKVADTATRRGQGPGPARQQKDRGQQQRRHCSDLLLLRFVHCNLPARVRESTWSGPPQAPCRWRTMAWKRLRDKYFNSFSRLPGCPVARLPGCPGERAALPEAGWRYRGGGGEMVAVAAISTDCRTATAFEGMDQAKIREAGAGRGPPAGRLSFRGRPRLIP